MEELKQIEKYLDVNKLNAISNYLYLKDYDETFQDGRPFISTTEREKILKLYMEMDRNDVNYYLAKKIEELGELNSEATKEIADRIRNQHFN